ncbi:MAG: hypothetical protein HQK51_07780 [Oligoflexia bacterium]|nr:hypothetical protein [Oligoflexia bacterium]
MKLIAVILFASLLISFNVFASTITNTNVTCDSFKVGINNKLVEVPIIFDGTFEEMLKAQPNNLKATFSDNNKKGFLNLKVRIMNYNLFDEYVRENVGFVPTSTNVKIYSVKMNVTSDDYLDMKSIGCVSTPTKDTIRYLICREEENNQ